MFMFVYWCWIAKMEGKMIINFNVENFGSIKERQTLTFEAEKSTHLEQPYVVETAGLRLLKLAVIYGANASGKTTLLRALDFLRELVQEPLERKNEELDFLPFLFDPHTPGQPSFLGISFVQEEVRYLYEVKFNRKAILEEVLYAYNPKKSKLFERTTDQQNQLTSITFGQKLKLGAQAEKILESNTLWNNTVLGGFLKTNLDGKALKDTTDWFKDYLRPLVQDHMKVEGFVASNIRNGEIRKEDVLAIVRKADLRISDINFREEIGEENEGFLELMRKRMNLPDSVMEEMAHYRKNSSSDIEFEHTIDGKVYHLPLKLESAGTRRFFGFAGLLSLLVRRSSGLVIDELEASLHPDLFQHFLLLFLTNSGRSQVLATTHLRELLNDRDVFRNDAIWFVQKGEDGATQLYSLTDFDTSVIRDNSNILNAYKSGRLGAVPHLSDYFLHFDS